MMSLSRRSFSRSAVSARLSLVTSAKVVIVPAIESSSVR